MSERLDGKSIDMDPGEHVFRFEHKQGFVEQTLVVRQAEKSRKIVVDFTAKKSPAPTSSGPPAAAEAAPAPSSVARPVPAPVYVLGGVGVASLAVGTIFFFAQKSQHDDLAARCAPACSPDDVAPLKTKQLVAGLGLGVGVAALAAATVLYVRRPEAQTTASFSVSPNPGGATFAIQGGF